MKLTKDSGCFLCGPLTDRGGFVAVGSGIGVTGDLAPIQNGHALLFHEEHYLSFSRVPDASMVVVKEACHTLSEYWGNRSRTSIFFEHGPLGGSGNFVGCCDHAHIHSLPVSDELVASEGEVAHAISRRLHEEVGKGNVRSVDQISVDDLSNLKDIEYFWFSVDLNTLLVFELLKPERQFMRRITSQILGVETYRTWDMVDFSSAAQTTEIAKSLF